MERFFKYWLPLLAHAGLIFYLSSRSDFPAEPVSIPFSDKIAHVFLYCMLGFLFLRAWVAGKYDAVTWKTCLVVVVFVTLYGISDEVHQMFVPNRTPSFGDVIADAIGGAIAALAMKYWKN